MADQQPTQEPEEQWQELRRAAGLAAEIRERLEQGFEGEELQELQERTARLAAELNESIKHIEAFPTLPFPKLPLFNSAWFAGALRDYGAIVGFVGVIVTLALFAILALTGLGKLQANVSTLQTEFTRMRDTQTAQVQSLASLSAGVQQLNGTIEKQTAALDQFRGSMADNAAAIKQLAQAIDRLTIKLSDVERTANDNKNLLSRLDERTKGLKP